MKTRIFYKGPYEGKYKHLEFFNTLNNVPELKLKGRYSVPSKDGNEGEIGLGWQMGCKLGGAGLVYTVRFTTRQNRFTSFFRGSTVYRDVKVELKSLKKERIDGIEAILKRALSSE